MTSTHAQIAGAHRRSLRSIANKLRNMAAAWGDVDQFKLEQLEELADTAEQLAHDLTEGDAP